jgi:hypothetical protein
MPSFSDSLGIIMKPKNGEKFCTIAIFLPYVVEKYYSNESCMSCQDSLPCVV